MQDKILVLAVGNILLMDEGIALHVLNRLRSMDLLPEIELLDGGTGGYELINFIRGRKKVFIIDCININEQVGSVVTATLQEIDLTNNFFVSCHQGGLTELLQQSMLLTPLPEIFIIGIVPEEINKMGMQLSSTLESMLESIVSKVYKIIMKEISKI